MDSGQSERSSALLLGFMAAILLCLLNDEVYSMSASPDLPKKGMLLAPDNLVVSGLDADSKPRTPEERAELLKDLGFTRVVLGPQDVVTLDEQIEALKQRGIEI